MTTIEVENQIIFRGILFSKVYLQMDRYVVRISKKKSMLLVNAVKPVL